VPIEATIVRLKREYPGWGAPKIREKLRQQVTGPHLPAMVPISTHKTLRTSPIRSSFIERTFGVMRASSNILTLPPGNGGNRVSEIGIMRATSALASSMATPGFNRAIAEKPNCPSDTLLRSN
jgi:hypothetical protein